MAKRLRLSGGQAKWWAVSNSPHAQRRFKNPGKTVRATSFIAPTQALNVNSIPWICFCQQEGSQKLSSTLGASEETGKLFGPPNWVQWQGEKSDSKYQECESNGKQQVFLF
jgi:hypothetical protein